MPTFEETVAEFEKDAPDGDPPPKLTAYEFHIASHFWDAGQSAATFAANSKLGDEGNEGMKTQRLEVAISKLSARYPTKDEAEYLREVIAEAQG